MQYVNVADEFVSQILKANKIEQTEQGLNESAEVVVEEQLDEAECEVHACPLCESQLDEPISEEAMQECVDFVLETLNEAVLLEEELIAESEEDFDDEEE